MKNNAITWASGLILGFTLLAMIELFYLFSPMAWRQAFEEKNPLALAVLLQVALTSFIGLIANPRLRPNLARKNAEARETKHQMTRRQNLLLETSPSILYAHENAATSPHECTYITDGISNMIGYSSKQILADPNFWIKHLHPQDREYVLNIINQALSSTDSEITADYRFLTADGEYIWIKDNARLIRDQHGKLEMIVGSWLDITGVKRHEQELLRLRMAAEASVDMIFITNLKGVIEYANPSFCRQTGWDFTEIIGKTPRILKSGKNDDIIYMAMYENLQKGESWQGRLQNCRKPRNFGQRSESDYYWAEISITPILDPQGERIGYVSIQRDISEQVANEIAINKDQHDAELRLRIANILYRREPLADRFGAVLEELFQLRSLPLQPKGGVFLKQESSPTLQLFVTRGEFSAEFLEKEQCVAFGKCLCGRAAVSGEMLVSDDCFCDPRHENSYAGMQNHGHYIVPIQANSNMLGVMFLYTEPQPPHDQKYLEILLLIGQKMGLAILQAEVEQALKSARDLATESSRIKSDFLANMSHEIRTPMNGVLGMLDLLLQTQLNKEQYEYAKIAYNSAESLLNVINDILDFSKIESGKLDLEEIEFDLRELAEEICVLLAGRAHAKGLELNCYIQPDLPRAFNGDPTRLRQILNNLIGNAVKFTASGEVSLEMTCTDLTDDKASICFTVKDTGIGISLEQQSRLFQPFMQANSTTTRNFGGTGLGLSIAKNLIERMGGEIHLNSAPGQGATFWFTLQLPYHNKPEDSSSRKSLSGSRFLIVDDNSTNRKILERSLQNWDAECIVTENSLQALIELRQAISEQQPFDVVILDMQMPGMDGLNLAKQMQQDPDLREIKRIILSSGAMISTTDMQQAGIYKVLGKPIRQSYLYNTLLELTQPSMEIEPPELEPSYEQLDFSRYQIMLVEDNPVNQKVALHMLNRLGIQPQLAADGEEALEWLNKKKFDLVFMDCQMPKLDGYAATRMWREQEKIRRLPATPIIALTANAMQSDRDECLAAGMNSHLSKPFNIKKLESILQIWLTMTEDEPLTLWIPEKMEASLGGDQDLMRELIDILNDEECPEHLNRLQRALEQQNAAEIVYVAHTIKGMASQFCAESVKNLAAQIEKNARAGLIDAQEVERLAQQFRRLCVETKAYINPN